MKSQRAFRFLFGLLVTVTLTTAAWAGNLFSKPIDSPVGSWVRGVASGDFDGDGKPDLAVTNFSSDDTRPGQLKILLSRKSGHFRKMLGNKAGRTPFSVAIGDLNNDGKLDAVVVNPYAPGKGNLSVFFGNGDGTFQPQVKRGDTKHIADTVVMGDFNGDGNLDLALTNERSRHNDGFVSVLLGNGNGTFQAPITTATSQNPANLVAGDLNGDGKLDLIVSDYTTGGKQGGTFVLLGNGNGTFQVSFLERPGSKSIALGDFNGDGIPDLAEASGGGKVAIELGNGDGTFKPARHFSAGVVLSCVTLADFDQDGRLDVAVVNDDRGDVVEFLPGKGDGRLDAPTSYPLNWSNIGQMIAADVNGDGKLDLILTNYGNGSVSVLLNTGKK